MFTSEDARAKSMTLGPSTQNETSYVSSSPELISISLTVKKSSIRAAESLLASANLRALTFVSSSLLS